MSTIEPNLALNKAIPLFFNAMSWAYQDYSTDRLF